MTDDLTPALIAQMLRGLGKQLEEVRGQLEPLDEAATVAQHEAKQAYRRAFLLSPGAMDLRRVLADEAASDLQLAADIAGVRLRAAKAQVDVLKSRLEVARSLGPIMRLEWGQS